MNNSLQRFAEQSAKHIEDHFINNPVIMDFVKNEATAHLAKIYGVTNEEAHKLVSISRVIARTYDDLVAAGLVGCYIASLKKEV